MTTSRFVWILACEIAGMSICIAVPVTGLEWEQFTTADGLLSNAVMSLFEADDGSVWIGLSVAPWGTPGVNQYVDGEILTWDSGSWAPTDVTGFCQDNMTRIWASSYERGCVFLELDLWNEGFYWSATDPAFSNAGVKCDSKGRLWAGFLQGIVCYDPATDRSTKVWPTPSGGGDTSIRHLFIDAEDDIWFTCSAIPAPLIRMDQEGNELSSYPINGQVCQSADGTFWLARFSGRGDPDWFGVARLEGDEFVSVSPPAGSFPAEAAGPICITSRGEIVTGSHGWDSCGVFVYDGVNWQYNETPFDSPRTPIPITDLIADRNDDIWVGTTACDSGLWVLRRNQGQPDVAVGLSTNATEYAAADFMKVFLDIASAHSKTVDLYVAIELPSGDVVFYPSLGISWSEFWPGLLLPAGTDVENYELFSLTLPDLAAGTYRWFAACTHAGTTDS